MKWMLICGIALIVCFLIGFGIAKLIIRKKTNRPILYTTLLTIVFGLVLSVTTSFIYLNISYKPKEDALKALKGNDVVNVSQINNGYYFDGPGNNTALIFYPGSKVACEAYAPIMLNLSQNGIDCFLTSMPFNFALFGENRCESFLNSYSYESWILSGHSMGGLVSASYVSKHPEKIKGLVLLASYPNKTIPNVVNLLSIYGSNDNCMERGSYEKCKSNWPSNSSEYIIDGANHSQFGDYGNQLGDGQASITKQAQWEITSKKIIEWKNAW